MKRTLLLFVWIGFAFNLSAQNNGVAGKRGVLKTDIVNYATAKGANIAFEYAISKKISLDFEYRWNVKNMKPIYSYFEEEDVLPDRKFKVNSKFYTTSFRYYPSNQFNAPKGNFYYGKIGYGTAVIEGYLTRPATDNLGREIIEYVSYRESGIHYIPIEVGLGKQWVFGQYITFEVSAGYNITQNINTEAPISRGVSSRVGPTFIPISGHYLVQDIYSGLAHGISFSIRLGLMTPF